MAVTVRQALKGRGDFISDIYARDMHYGATIRSPFARASIRRIYRTNLPEDVICITAEDIPGPNELRVHDESMPLLADGETSYVGEPVALLAGPNQRAVIDAMNSVVVEYEERLPSYSFTQPGSSHIIARRVGERGDVEAALRRSASRVEGTYRTGIQEHLYNEPQGAVVSLEDGDVVVRTATQWPFHVRAAVATALGIAPRQCVVRPTDPGIALDGKLWYPSMVAAHAALLARATHRSVKLVYSNIEDFRFTSKRAPFAIRYVTGLTHEGNLCGAEVEIVYNAGAYGVFTDEICDRVMATTLASYECRDLRVSVTAVRTNLPPLNVLSGFGSASSFFAGETHVARVAEIAQMDPLEWRRENGLHERNGGRGTNGQARAARTLGAAAKASDFSRKFAAYELQKKRRTEFDDLRMPTHGIGIAVAAHGGGFIGDHEPRHGGTVVVRLETDGSAVLRTSAVPGSRSVLASWRDSVATILGLDAEDVLIENTDTSLVPDSGPSTLSRNIVVTSRLVEQACNAIQKRRFRSPLPIEVRRSYRTGRASRFDSATLSGTAFPHASYGAAVVEVAVDPVTFESTVDKVWLTVDAGRILDEGEAKRSLEMSVYQALEWATHELVSYRNGAIDPRSYLAYRNIADPVLPNIHIALLGSPDRSPERIGELPQSCVPAALAAAVSQATGRYMDRIPTNPALIHGYLEGE
ncbi:MAG: xanthine dehydrogenase family protein molybdopterin-binding subunit [Spirochaetota bacterium]